MKALPIECLCLSLIGRSVKIDKEHSMDTLHIWPQEPLTQEGSVLLSAVIETPGADRKTLRYTVPEKFQDHLATSSDHFAVGAVFLMMETGLDVRIHGQVSPSLLRNLCEFQSAWSVMRPKYKKVSIYADHEQEDSINSTSNKAIMTFSGGVDSCFTAFRHTRAGYERFPRNLTAAVMVQGFDIPLDDPQGFARATDRSRRILSNLGVELFTVSTNYREIIGDWPHSHGAAIASCLHLFSRGFSEGLIGQTVTYGDVLKIIEGVNALTDPLLSSDNFKIIPDGAAFTRADKILAISGSPELLADLRVCWEGLQKDRNCCNCEKCMRNILTFRALGLERPPCFEHDISLQQIRQLRMGDKERRRVRYEALLSLAADHGTTGQWSRVLAQRLAAQRKAEDPSIFLRTYRFFKRRTKKMLGMLKD